MKFRHEITYPAAPAEVFAMLGDRAFRERVCAALDVVSAEITVTPHGAGFILINDQVQKTGGLPAIAARVIGDTTRAIATETWADPGGGTLEISTPGKPTSAAGTVTLRATDAGTTQLIELDLKVTVPVIGRKLEPMMAEQIVGAYDVEESVGRAWLAEEHR